MKTILGLALLTTSCSTAAMRSVSDHFDGNRFFNPHYREDRGLFTFLRMRMGSDYAEWPDKVENSHRPHLPARLEAGQIAVTWINHATMLIQTADLNILTDPIWAERASPFTWAGPKRKRPPGLPFDELPPIHLVLVSHNHYDHMDLVTLKKLQDRFAPRFLVPLGDGQLLAGEKIKNVREMDWWDDEEMPASVKITYVPAQHFSARGMWDRNRSLWGGFMIAVSGRKIYFAGDTGYTPQFKEIRERLGAPDVAFLPIGAYEPNWFMAPMHMNPAEAVRAHEDLGAKASIPMHYGTFQMSAEAIDQPVRDLLDAMKNKNPVRDQFHVLHEGQTRIFP